MADPQQVTQALLTAVAFDDVRPLLAFWDEVVHPIPDEEWGPNHPQISLALFVAYAIEDLGEQLMTPDQRLASLLREGFHNQALPHARA